MTEPAAAAAARPVLVLYAPADEPFVRGFLLPALDQAPGIEARGAQVIDAHDLAAIALDELEQALQRSGVAIAVISAAFLTNQWSRYSELLATRAAIENALDVIPLVLDGCTLPLHIKVKLGLDFQAHDRWDGEVRRLCAYLARPVPVEADLPCPYPGMRPFQAADAASFHGRDGELTALLALVKAGEREIYLVGPSGSGKSSLIAAGLLPRLAAQPSAGELIVRTMRPGDAPLRRLAECLELAPTATPDPAAVAAWTARHAGASLVVVVDQLEELFAQAPRAEQAGFATAISALRGEPRCLIVLALRADFYGELLQSPLWLDGRRQHIDLTPLRGLALRQAIELPARALEVYFEPGLIDRLLADAAEEPGALPMLQETLVQLWGHRRRRLLTQADYDALGDGRRSGLAVAIAARADRCLGAMTPPQVAIARRVLLRLVSFGEGRPNTRRRQPRAQLAGGEPPAALDDVLRLLVAARLITLDGDGHPGDDLVDLCHEALITAWPAFAAWVEARRADEQRRRQIQATADEWIARGRGATGLLDEGELAAALAWRNTDAARELGESAEVTALVDGSRDALVRAHRRWLRRIVAVGAGLAVLAAIAVVKQRQAQLADVARVQAELARGQSELARGQSELARRNAVATLGEQYRDLGRQAVTEGHLLRAIPYLVAAREQGLDDANLRRLFRIATRSTVVRSLHHGAAVTGVSFSQDGSRIVTASLDGTARVWDAASGAPLMPPLAHAGPISSATIGADAGRLLTIETNGKAWLWDVTSSPPLPIALPHDGRVNAASFSPDGTMVVTASDDHTARVWSARTGGLLLPPLAHAARVLSAQLNRDGSRIATIDSTGESAGIWDAKTGARIARFQQGDWRDWSAADLLNDRAPLPHGAQVWSATFSADGKRILTTGNDHSARVWDAATGKVVLPPFWHKDYQPYYGVFSPDGAQITTVDSGDRVQIWDVASHAVVRPVLEHASWVSELAYSDDSARLVTVCKDDRVRVWDAANGSLEATLDIDGGATDAAISPNGTRVVTASPDRVARVWEVRPAVRRVLEAGPRAYDAAYSPDGARIATTDTGGTLRVWAASGALQATLHLSLGTSSVTFDRDGHRLAAVALDGLALLADAATASLPIAPLEPGDTREVGVRPDKLLGHTVIRDAFSPDGRRFATTGTERGAGIWDTASGRAVTPPLRHGAAVVTIRYSPDGRRVVTAGKDGAARVWDAESGEPLGLPLKPPAGGWMTGAVFSPDGTRIATVNNVYDDHRLVAGTVALWNAASGRLDSVLTGHGGWIIAAAFSPDGTLLLTNSDDRSARLWNVTTGTLAVPPLPHSGTVESAAFSLDGTRVVTASDHLAQVWDVRTGRPVAPPFIHMDGVRTAMFSPDGSSVLTVAQDAVRIWDVEVDAGGLEDWRRIARDSSSSELADAPDRHDGHEAGTAAPAKLPGG